MNKNIPVPDWYNGNIDLDQRKVYTRPEDGMIQTEESIDVSFDPGDKYTVRIPKVIDGNKPVDRAAAEKHFFETGQHLGVTHRAEGETVQDFYNRVNAASIGLHNRQEQMYVPQGLGIIN
jgi:hypothetical protein